MIGYGFMGRAHSNAFRKVGNFFNLPYKIHLKAACARNADKLKAFAEQWGYESTETDWRKLIERKDIDLIDICAPNNTHAEIALAAAPAGKMILCEKPLAMNGAEGSRWSRRRTGRRAQHGLVQLPPHPRRHPGQAAPRRGPPGQNLPLPGQIPPGLDHQPRRAPGRTRPVAAGRAGGRQRRHRRPAGPLHRHRLVAQRLDDFAVCHDRDLRQGTQACRDRQDAKGRHRRRLRLHWPVQQRLAGQLREYPLCPRAQGAVYLRDQRRACLASFGTYTTCTGCSISTTATGDAPRLAFSIHVTDSEHPYMAKWWVPGLAIGYEHSFVHQVADFLQGVAEGKPVGPTFKDALETQYVCDAVLKSAQTGKWEKVKHVK
jgi:hypothetical protein